MINKRRGVTIIELLVVLAIIGILATVAVGVYTKEVYRARVAACKAEIQMFETAIERYYSDTGQYPPSGSGTLNPFAQDPVDDVGVVEGGPLYGGMGYCLLALTNSLTTGSTPLHPSWKGPYIQIKESKLLTLDGLPTTSGTPLSRVQYLDPFGYPYHYVRSEDYGTSTDAFTWGTKIPASNPYAAVNIWYNPSTFQIVSIGYNGYTEDRPDFGTDEDDQNNFE